MVKKLLRLSLLLCDLSLLVVSTRAAAQANTPPMDSAVQDATGTVWALPQANQGDDNGGTIYRWQARHWIAQELPGAAGFRQRAMTRGDDGSVYVLWQKWAPGQSQMMPQCLITMQRGDDAHVTARFADSFAPEQSFFSPSLRSLWVGVGNDIWMADSSSNLRHLAADGTVSTFPCDPKQYFGGKFVPGFPTQPLSSFTDSQGRRWFWQAMQHFWDPTARRGVLIWDGKTLAHHPTFPGLPDRPCTIVAPLDSHTLWVAQPENGYPWVPKPRGGLYQIDTRTLSAVAVTPPEKDAFQSAVRIVRINGSGCVLDGWSTERPRTDLWRQQGRTWHKEPQALADSLNGWEATMPQASLETHWGTWLSVNGAGLYWLPKEGKWPVRVDWRRGCSAGRVSALFRLSTGHILAFGTGGSTEMTSVPPPLYPIRPEITVGEPSVPAGVISLFSDQRCHLWGLEYLVNGQHNLDEWDGKVWHKYPVPKSIAGVNAVYASDTHGRLWLATQNWDPKTQSQPVEGRAVYDPSHRTWASYAKVQDALQASASLPGLAFLPNHSLSQPPIFSGDGRVTYTDYASVFLGDGKTWHRWKPHDVQPGNTNYNFDFNNPPRFNLSGHLEVDWSTETWDWTPDGGWQLVGPIKLTTAPLPLPPGGPKGYWGTPLTDNRGAQWVAWKNDIYLTRHGLWAKQTALSGPGSPFWDGRGVSDVLQDPNGHYFFATNPGGNSEYVVWSPPASKRPPAPPIQILPLSRYSVTLRFALTQPGAHWVQWRLNGGVWSAPLTTDTVALTALRPGRYRVEAQAIDALLQASPEPSAAVFVIQSASAAQIVRWVQTLLTGSDIARETAVAGLVKQPGEALPALKAARPGASEDARWWIDAALQQITPQSAGSE